MPLNVSKIASNGAFQLLATAPNTHPWGSLNVVAANTTAGAIPFELYVTTDASPNPVDCIDPGAVIPAKGRYELSCRLIQAGEKVYIKAAAGVSVRAELNLAIEN